MDDVRLLIDLHRPNARLGPGSDATTRQALELSGLLGRPGLRVADLGCGTGASAMALAEHLDARITAVAPAPPGAAGPLARGATRVNEAVRGGSPEPRATPR